MHQNPIFNMDNETSAQVLALIVQILLCINTPYFEEFCCTCMTALWTVFEVENNSKLKPEVYEGMWMNYHKLKTQLTTEWDIFLSLSDIHSTGKHVLIVFQKLLLDVFLLLLKARNATEVKDITSNEEKMDKEEERVLRYVAGYVPYALLKKFRKQKNPVAKLYCRFLESWQVIDQRA